MKSAAKRLREPLKRIILGLQPPAADSEWAVDRHDLKGVKIHWPATLDWRYTWGWVEPLFRGFRARLPVIVTDVPQHLKRVVLIEFHRRDQIYRVGINYSDDPDRVYFGTSGDPLDLEFKMQYRNGGYGERNIVPGGYVSNSMLVDWHSRGPRKVRDRQQFEWDVYGRFGANFATEIRTKAVETLQNQRRVQFYGGLRKVSFAKFLGEIARSRVCIDLPGNGPFCFRLVSYMAVGACVVSPPHATTMPVPLVDRKHIVYTKPDMSDMVDLCEKYANDAPAREAIKEAARDYYRKNLYWRSLADYYLRTTLDRLPE